MHYILTTRELIGRGLDTLAGLGSLWFISWGIRRAGEFDHALDFAGQTVRWVLVVVLLGAMTYFPGSSAPRLALLLGGATFLAWPNFAYHLTRFLRWCKLLPKQKQPPPGPPPPQQAGNDASPFRSPEPTIFGLNDERQKKEHRQTYTVRWK